MTDPILVFGALRSGTTLFRLMLNSHEGLTNPGEVDFLFDFLTPDASHPTGWRYDRVAMAKHRIFRAHGLVLPADLDGLDLLTNLIDQFRARTTGVLTLNFHRHADRAAAVLPAARFIHLLRDPRDVARSSIGMGWAGNSYYGVGHWITTEDGWDAAGIDPDRVLTLQFEALMSDLEPQLKQVCAFIGVGFSPVMLDYHQNTTYGPPDPTIAQQWRNQASPREVALIEGRCVALMTARGYALNGTPTQPSGPKRLYLAVHNRLRRWQFNINRFGLPLFLSSHLTRRLGPRWLYDRLRSRMDEKAIRLLK